MGNVNYVITTLMQELGRKPENRRIAHRSIDVDGDLLVPERADGDSFIRVFADQQFANSAKLRLCR
jgi:hypothetical protein